jgi:hypothetical protein
MTTCGERGIPGTSLCNAQNICCIQLKNDCGKACGDIPNGYSIIQATGGELEWCYDDGVGGCDCTVIGSNQPEVASIDGFSASSENITITGGPPSSGHLLFTITLANPSSSRPMEVLINWSGFAIFVDYDTVVGDVDVIVDPILDINVGAGFNPVNGFTPLNNNLQVYYVGARVGGNFKYTASSQSYHGVVQVAAGGSVTFRSQLTVNQNIVNGVNALILEQVGASLYGTVI